MDADTLTRALAAIQEAEERTDAATLCADCDGSGHLGTARDGRLVACEKCGGHEDALGLGWIVPDASGWRTDVPALAAVALAAARVMGEPGWWCDVDERGTWCGHCLSVGAENWEGVSHEPDCRALELESALQELAGGEV